MTSDPSHPDLYIPKHWKAYDAFKEEEVMRQEALDRAYGILYEPKHAKKEGDDQQEA